MVVVVAVMGLLVELMGLLGRLSTPNCDCRNYDSQLRPSHLRRICAAVAADKTGSPYNNPKKGQDPGRVAGGHGGGLVKYEPKKPIRQNDNPDGPGIPKEPRA